MNRGRNKQIVFLDSLDYQKFLDILQKSYDFFGLECHSYCLMPNHYHLLVKTPKANISRAMRHLDGVYTQYFNRIHGRDGTLFKGRFKSILVERESYLLELSRYIHHNPIKAQLEKKLGEYPWSSFNSLLKPTSVKKSSFLKTSVILGLLNDSKAQFIKCMLESPDDELTKRLQSSNWPSVLGTAKFREMIRKKYILPLKGKREIPQIKTELNELDVEAIKEYLRNAANVRDLKLDRRNKDKLSAEIKRSFIYCCRNLLKFGSAEIKVHLNAMSTQAVSLHYQSAIKDVDGRKGCYQLIRAVNKSLLLVN